ncbi:MAG: hypothetical protein RL204_362 [Bacteroidota bacterium]|jgi:transcriptional regulator CtsR
MKTEFLNIHLKYLVDEASHSLFERSEISEMYDIIPLTLNLNFLIDCRFRLNLRLLPYVL